MIGVTTNKKLNIKMKATRRCRGNQFQLSRNQGLNI